MIAIDCEKVFGIDTAIRGMRNPYDSWLKSDSTGDTIGKIDMELCKQLIKSGSDHRKFLRQIIVSCDIKAPFYWWKEYDTYKVGTAANSCSTMHCITKKAFSLEDFSFDELSERGIEQELIACCNFLRNEYLKSKDKRIWRRLIQILPMSYNQLRTVTLNYEVLMRMHSARKNHRLQEWRDFCEWIEGLPYMKEFLSQS